MKKFDSVGVGPGCTGGNCALASQPKVRAKALQIRMRLDEDWIARMGNRSFYLASGGGPSGPDDPKKTFFPPGNVMSRPLARCDPSLAWKPSKMTSVPTGISLL